VISIGALNQMMYKQLLDLVNLDERDDDDDDDTASETGSQTGDKAAGGEGKVEITDQQVLDLFVVFGKPFALDKSFLLTGGLVAILQGCFMGFACLAFFNVFDFTSRSWLGCWEEGQGVGGSAYLNGMQHGHAPVRVRALCAPA
jgi:hypothetical protein